MEDLSFDPVKEIDTTQAKRFIEEHKVLEVGPEKDRCFLFGYRLTIEDPEDFDLDYVLGLRDERAVINDRLRRKFKTKLKEKEELFCQLEYLIRKNDLEDTKKQLKLILHYLECYDAFWQEGEYMPFIGLLVTEDTPLYYLGYVLGAAYCGVVLRVYTTMKAAPLCHLFYHVCLHAGIYMFLANINDQDVEYVRRYCQKTKRCTAVFTEHADIQSAVDVFLNSSPRAPWRIDRILVQESMIDEVKSAFSAYGKGRRMDADRPRQYVAAFETRRGTVAVTVGCSDGASVESGGVVAVSTYRTVRELVALLATSSPHFLSLWCSERAQAHEVAAAAAARTVWIDGLADFDGPPEIALTVFTDSWYHTYLDRKIHPKPDLRYDVWSTLKPEKRKSIMLNSLDYFPLNQSVFGDSNSIQADHRSIESWSPNDLVHLQTEKMTIVADRPEQDVICWNTKAVHVLKLLVQGYSVVTNSFSKRMYAMTQFGIPVTTVDAVERESVPITLNLGKKKMIQMAYGTMYEK